MHAERVSVTVTTDGAGAATGYTDPVTGRILTAIYTKVDFENGSTITVTTESTAQAVWSETGVNASTSRAPRQATHSILGAAAVYAGGGSPVLDHITVAKERIKVVIASGGAAKSGTFSFIIG